jgi:hypothetical protein
MMFRGRRLMAMIHGDAFRQTTRGRKLAHGFLWEYSYKRLKLAQLLGQPGIFLTWTSPRSGRARRRRETAAEQCCRSCKDFVGADAQTPGALVP